MSTIVESEGKATRVGSPFKRLTERVNAVEIIVDKIRYAMSYKIEQIHVLELLELFNADSGKLKKCLKS